MKDSCQQMHELLDAFVECDLDESQRQLLNDLLRTDSVSRRTYCEYFAIHAALAWDAVDRVHLAQELDQHARGGAPTTGLTASRPATPPVEANTHASRPSPQSAAKAASARRRERR